MSDWKNFQPPYKTPDIIAKQNDLVSCDTVLAFRDGLLPLHSLVIRRSSDKMNDFFTAETPDCFRLDLRHFYLIHGLIVKQLLYEGTMHETVDPSTSHISAEERIQLLLRSREIIESLGFTCILGTINTWIERISGIVHVISSDDSKTDHSPPEALLNETASTDSGDMFPSSPLTDIQNDLPLPSLPKNIAHDDKIHYEDAEMVESCVEAPTYVSERSPSPTVPQDNKRKIPDSSDSEYEEAHLDGPESSSSETEEEYPCSPQIKSELGDSPDQNITVGSLRSPSPQLYECNFCCQPFSTEEKAKAHFPMHLYPVKSSGRPSLMSP